MMGSVNDPRSMDNGRRSYLDQEAESGLSGQEWLNRRETVKDKVPCNLIGMFFFSQMKRQRRYINQNGLGCAVVMNILKDQWLNTLRFIPHSCYLITVSLY